MVNVFIYSKIGGDCLKEIAAVSPNVKILDGSSLCAGTFGKLTEPVNVTDKKGFADMLARAEIVYGHSVPVDIVARAPNLKWIQTMLAGANTILNSGVAQSRVTVTNSKGIHLVPGGELALTLMLDLAKQMPAYQEKQKKKSWGRTVEPPALLHTQTLGILGLGYIGKGVARLGKGFGMKVIATRRSVKIASPARYVDMVYPADQLLKVLSESDFVVNCLPLTPETNRIIGEREINAMKPSAFFINVGRGTTVDEPALTRALENGRIAGAGLDTFAKEPLSTDSRLWELPNVIITPHIAGQMQRYAEMATDLFCENLKRYLAGKRLHNIVDKKKGY